MSFAISLLNCRRFLSLTLCSVVTAGVLHAKPVHPAISITLTEHGIPHITAPDYFGLGYGYGYAMADNDICGMGSMFATYAGERALRLGEDKTDVNYLLGRRPINNAVSDFALRLMADDVHVRQAERSWSPQIRSLMGGYVQGFNAYLRARSAVPPDSCRDTALVRAITTDDVQRRIAGLGMLLGSGLVLQELYDAAPPTDKVADARRVPTSPDMSTPSSGASEPALPGSNAYAFGRDTTDNGSGLLLGNPHFFWDGPNRFVEMHLTIPGEYDVMGVALQGVPLINIGFNHDLAWTHTVSTDMRGTIYRLALDPADATHYMLGGRSVAMTPKRVTISVRTPNGTIEKRTHEFWMTTFGPVLSGNGIAWTRQFAYALTDANQDNDRSPQQWLEIGKSRNVGELRASLEHRLGLPWVNTVAADRDGNAFYGDMSVAPNLDAATLHDCSVAVQSFVAHFFAVLDASRGACLPNKERATRQPDVLPSNLRPTLTRADFVANSNGSHWLINAAAPLEGFSPVIGPERIAQSLRTRQGQIQVNDRLTERDGLPGNRMSQAALEQILFSGRSLQAEMLLDDLLASCRRAPSADIAQSADKPPQPTGNVAGQPSALKRGCAALAKWNRRYDLDSIGSQVFTEFVNQAKQPGSEDLGTTPGIWRVPFDPADPVNTPRSLNTDNPAVLQALARAVDRLDKAEIPLEATLAEVQFVLRDGVRIPLHGGATYSSLRATLTPKTGYTEPMQPSNSYIQVVTFDSSGPIADAILASSQSPNPKSEFYADQTWAYSRKQWMRLPFTPADIAAAAIRPITHLTPVRAQAAR
jgi:acyl-homoserine-lactone acylase